MRPYGRIKTQHFPGKEDCHPSRGYVNWWEAEMGGGIVPRSTLKALARNEIQEEIDDIDHIAESK